MSVEVGPTAALAVVLIAIDVPHDPGAASLVPYLVGGLVVPVAWSAWYGCTVVFGRRGLPAPPSGRSGAPWRERRPHAIRVGIAVAVAVGVAGLLPDDLVGGHWLVTSVVLTVQPVDLDLVGVRLHRCVALVAARPSELADLLHLRLLAIAAEGLLAHHARAAVVWRVR